MPEIKRNFTKGKMNKDVDERLVSPGEYRHAENIQVSTSEGSDVGTVQNIVGNIPGCDYTQGWVNPIPVGSTTVGSIADEKNDTLYWLVSGHDASIPTDWTVTSTLKDMILRTNSSFSSNCEPVFVDTYAIASNNTENNDVNALNITGNLITQIEPGWTVTGVTSDGETSNTAEVVYLDYGDPYGFEFEFVPNPVATYGTTYCAAGTNPMCGCMSIQVLGYPNFGAPGFTMATIDYVYLVQCQNLNNIPGYIGDIITIDDGAGNTQTFEIIDAALVNPAFGSFPAIPNMVRLQLDNPLQAFTAMGSGANFGNPMTSGMHNGMALSSTWDGVSITASAIPLIPGGTTNVPSGWLNVYQPGAPGGFDTTTFNVGDSIEITMGPLGPSAVSTTYCVDSIGTSAGGYTNAIQIGSPDPLNPGQCIPGSAPLTPIPGYPWGMPITAGVFTAGSSIFANLDQTILLDPSNISGISSGYTTLIWSGPRVLNFNPDSLITGINIVDDMLYWTDGSYNEDNNLIGTEPKKINIPRSVLGTNWDGLVHTDFINPDRSITTPAREKHITVIKEAPLSSPTLKMIGKREGNSNGVLTYTFPSTSSSGDEVILNINPPSGISDLNYKPGDILFIKIDNGSGISYPITEPDVRVVIDETPTAFTYECTILSVSDSVPNSSQTYGVDLDNDYEKLYSLKFPRFALRYKYQDGEYSTYGPFSEVAFLPGNYDYLPNKGYNLGMQNQLRELTLGSIIPGNVPDGVVQVDILYKESDSPNVYTVDEIKPSDLYWTSNSYTITEETIKAVLPSNQLLRPWDNVPRKALAQEVTGSRIVYGNYLQNYNLSGLRPEFTTTLKPRKGENIFKSVKSIRDYQLGVVYCDKYNRQTPVLSDASASLSVAKMNSDKKTQIEIKPLNTAPSWATHHKFYIKDTYSEYYNLSLDRYYDAKDDNIWLAFPSHDRNKLDLDTSLHLKKKYNSSEADTSSKLYKIVDIKNEAPEYIKTRRSILGRVGNETVSPVLFDQDDYIPRSTTIEFKINVGGLAGTILENFHKRHNSPDADVTVPPGIHSSGGALNNGPLFIRIVNADSSGVSGVTQGLATEWYEVDNIKKHTNQYIVRLKKEFGTDADWTHDTANALSAGSGIGDHTYLYGGTNYSQTHQLALEVGQDIVQNKALFQGRFFAKILKDEVIEDSIISQGIFANTTVLATANAGYLKDFTQEDPGMGGVWSGLFSKNNHAAEIGNFQTNGFPHNCSMPIYPCYSDPVPDGKPVPTDAYWSYYVWQQIQAKLDANESRWVIDEAFATGEEPYWGALNYDWSEEHWSAAMPGSYWGMNEATQHQSPFPNHVSSIYGGYHWKSTNSLTMYHNQSPVITPQNHPSIEGLGHGAHTHPPNRANYEYFSEGHGVTPGNDYIDLSYVGTGRLDFGIVPPGYIYAFNQQVTVQADYMATNSTSAPPIDIDSWNYFKDKTTRWRDYWKIHGTNTNSNSNVTDIGDSLDEKAQKFADYLIIGSHIRFVNDPAGTIYEITNVKKIYKLNYSEGRNTIAYPFSDHANIYKTTGVTPFGFGNHPFSETYADWYHRPHFNRRITFRLYLKSITNGTSPGDNIATYDPTSGVDISGNFCPIEIISQNYITDNDIPFPEDPAVFETEPKTSEGLDVFHEISDTLPLNLSGAFNGVASFGNDFAPVGSVATTVPGTINTGQANILGWVDNVVQLDQAVNDSVIANNDKFYFTRPDGTYTVGQFAGLAAPIDSSGPANVSFFVEIQPNVQNNRVGLGWHNCYAYGNGVESNRIRDTFNSVYIDKGPKVSTTLSEGYNEEHRKYGLIYSGLYNSTSGVNNLNQFIQAEKITKDINPTYGSIQKLHTRDTDLITLCEDKVLKILANKDAVFNADGNTNLTATANVLG